MHHSGFVTLTELIEAGICGMQITCKPCKRKGLFKFTLSMQHNGEMGLRDVLTLLTQDCPKHGNIAIQDRCKAGFKLNDAE